MRAIPISREAFIRRLSQTFIVISAIATLLAAPAFAQGGQGVKEIPYESVPNFLKVPADVYMGEGIGVARNSKGHVFTYTRSGSTSPTDVAWDAAGNIFVADGFQGNTPRILKMDKNGRFVKTFGGRGSEPGQEGSFAGLTSFKT